MEGRKESGNQLCYCRNRRETYLHDGRKGEELGPAPADCVLRDQDVGYVVDPAAEEVDLLAVVQSAHEHVPVFRSQSEFEYSQ